MNHHADRQRSAGHSQGRERLLAEARLLGCWGALRSLGAEDQDILDAISKEDLGSHELAALARVGARALAENGSLARVLEDGHELSFWVQLLLAAEPREGAVLSRAAEIVAADAGCPENRGSLWSKLRLLAEAGASLGDGFGALAREARDSGLTSLAEGFYAASREARKGADLPQALRAVGGLSPLEQLCLVKLDEDADAALAALETVATYAGESTRAEESAFEGFAQAASETAAPLRRGLEGLISKVEGVLGFERAPSPRASLAREALQARGRQGSRPPNDPKPAGAQSDRVERAEAVEADRLAGARKTIAGDSGPVRVGRLPDTALEAWVVGFDEARAKLALLEVQPAETAIAKELEAELRALRGDLTGELDTEKRRAQFADLEGRFAAWREEHGGI